MHGLYRLRASTRGVMEGEASSQISEPPFLGQGMAQWQPYSGLDTDIWSIPSDRQDPGM